MNKLKKLLLTSSVLSLVLFLSGCMKLIKMGMEQVLFTTILLCQQEILSFG